MSKQRVKGKRGVTLLCHGYGAGPTIGCCKHLRKLVAALGHGTSKHYVSKHGVGYLLYLSMWSLVRNLLMMEGFATCCTPVWVVTIIVFLDLSIGMFHLFASVGASTILR